MLDGAAGMARSLMGAGTRPSSVGQSYGTQQDGDLEPGRPLDALAASLQPDGVVGYDTQCSTVNCLKALAFVAVPIAVGLTALLTLDDGATPGQKATLFFGPAGLTALLEGCLCG